MFAIGVAHELCRVLENEPSINYREGTPQVGDKVQIFISHAKVGNEQGVAKRLRELLKACATNDEQRLVVDIMSYFRAHAESDLSSLSFGNRYHAEAKPGKEQDLTSGLEELFLAYAKLDRGKAIAEEFRLHQQQAPTRHLLRREGHPVRFRLRQGHRKVAQPFSVADRSDRRLLDAGVVPVRGPAGQAASEPGTAVNAVRWGERRAFPYLGNVPTIRFSGLTRPNYPTIVAQMVVEVLRTLHFKKHFQDLRELFQIHRDIEVLTLSPELLTLLDLRHEKKAANQKEAKLFVYPDPPLSDDELDLLREFDEDLTVTTPIFLLGTEAKSASQAATETTSTTGPTPKLHGKTVGLSISNSPDVGSFAMSNEAHLVDAVADFSRYLLASGAAWPTGATSEPAVSPSSYLIWYECTMPMPKPIWQSHDSSRSWLGRSVSNSARKKRLVTRMSPSLSTWNRLRTCTPMTTTRPAGTALRIVTSVHDASRRWRSMNAKIDGHYTVDARVSWAARSPVTRASILACSRRLASPYATKSPPT